MSPRLVLVGPPGVGKSSVGRAVAELWSVPFTDTDEAVAQEAGRSVGDIFLEDGEGRFRELERAAVVAALAGGGVLALGGGAVMDPLTEHDLIGHPVVFLDVGPMDAARRIGFNRDRPLLIGNPRAQWTRLMEHRRPVYERVSRYRVATDGRDVAEVAAEVSHLVGQPS